MPRSAYTLPNKIIYLPLTKTIFSSSQSTFVLQEPTDNIYTYNDMDGANLNAVANGILGISFWAKITQDSDRWNSALYLRKPPFDNTD